MSDSEYELNSYEEEDTSDEYEEYDYYEHTSEDDFEEEINDNKSCCSSSVAEQNDDIILDEPIKTKSYKKDDYIYRLIDEYDRKNKVIVNENMKKFINKLFIKSEAKNKEFSDMFYNPKLEEFNKKKNLDTKHAKFTVDKYGLLIRENKYNKLTEPFGWKFDENEEPINIHVSEELQATKTKDEIFDIVMTELINQKGKINLTSKSMPTQIYTLLNIDISKYIVDKK